MDVQRNFRSCKTPHLDSGVVPKVRVDASANAIETLSVGPRVAVDEEAASIVRANAGTLGIADLR